MAKVLKFQFKNHPMVSTELVKFLSLNTSVEAVDKLTAQHLIFQREIKELKTELAAVARNSSTNGNKVTEFSPKLVTLTKRIERVESKANSS